MANIEQMLQQLQNDVTTIKQAQAAGSASSTPVDLTAMQSMLTEISAKIDVLTSDLGSFSDSTATTLQTVATQTANNS